MKSWRVNLTLFLLFSFGALIVGRLIFLQIINHGFYKAFAQGLQNEITSAKGQRGALYLRDKNGSLYTLASDQSISSAIASPAQIANPEEASAALSEILQLEAPEILSRIQSQQNGYALLKKQISSKEAELVRGLNLAGVFVRVGQTRSYPQGALAAHAAGFTNQDGNGQYGVEAYYNARLEGKEGLRAGVKAPASYLLNALAGSNKDGEDVVLTIDYNIQSFAETLLEKARENLRIDEGTIIVMEPASGKILTLANAPAFDPNAFSKVPDIGIFQNAAIQKIYEPGSIFKAFTMAAALDAGAITPETTYVDQGFTQIGGRKIANYDQRTWGRQTMTSVLEHSINTGAVFAEQQLGHENFLEYLERFGIFEPTDVDLAGEIFSRNTEFKKGYEINFATASFGQGIEMTSMQIVKAFSAIANNGVLSPPFLAEKYKSAKAPERVLSSKTASQLTQMLASVVQNGFAKSAQIPGYHIAGKTGTAQIAWSALGVQKAGYSDKTVQSFIGYAPAFDPRFLILVKLDDPAAKTAEYSATPIFRELAKYIIDYYQIPPDY